MRVASLESRSATRRSFRFLSRFCRLEVRWWCSSAVGSVNWIRLDFTAVFGLVARVRLRVDLSAPVEWLDCFFGMPGGGPGLETGGCPRAGGFPLTGVCLQDGVLILVEWRVGGVSRRGDGSRVSGILGGERGAFCDCPVKDAKRSPRELIGFLSCWVPPPASQA
jgi:hypothetical protein